jgi:hypothetical protein
MNGKMDRAVPGWFWLVAGLAVLWEAFGCYMYLSLSLAEPGARATEYVQMASWEWGVFAVAVWSGLIGAVGLLLRRAWATPALLLSLIAAAVQYGYTALQRGIPGDKLAIPISVLVVGVALVIISSRARRAGWLR